MEVDSRFNCDGTWPVAQDNGGSAPASTTMMDMVTLQQVLPQDFSSIYFAKVDTEGGELSVLHALLPYVLRKKVTLQDTRVGLCLDSIIPVAQRDI